MLYYRLRVRVDGLLASYGGRGNIGKVGTAEAGRVSGSGRGGWEEVVRRHEADMWVDLPAVQNQLGPLELTHTMRLYQEHYQCAKLES